MSISHRTQTRRSLRRTRARGAAGGSGTRVPGAAIALCAILLFPASDAAAQAAPWKQGVRYDIEATLDEDREVLRARARFNYVNRSPETLDRLYFHQHLNAFRPGSTWARVEERERFDFQNLPDSAQAFERMLSIRRLPAGAGGSDIVGRDMRWSYPEAPDSTVLEVPLPDALEPGEEITLELDWEARPSTLCRRQCREGRQYDFAQWYPRIAPYDRSGWAEHVLYPQGEFYGDFASYDVTLDLRQDQVVGATGVVVSGDPGWGVDPSPAAGVAAAGAAPRLNLLPISPRPGRKRVRFRAEDVHHFAWSTSPTYIHEGGTMPPTEAREHPIDIHVLYRPGDEEEWGSGQAVERTVQSLQFLEQVFGPYPWPQLTNLHRLEGGGTEFPMVIMDGSASPGLIMHETAHQYAHGIFANNEWKDAWLDEGFASFLTSWAFEEGQPGTWRGMREGMAETERSLGEHPIATHSEDFADFGTYGYMAYSRPEFVYHMLRGLVGEETFRDILHEYYERYALKHVDEDAFRSVVEDVSGEDLDWFFEQWLHTTATLDYAIGEVTQEETEDGWRTRVEVVREGDAWMPVELRVGDEVRELDSRGRSQRVEFVTDERPTEAMLDPDGWILDSDPENDRREIPEPAG